MTFDLGISSSTSLAIGWSVLHSLWVGSVVTLIAVALRRTVRSSTPEARYVVAVSCAIAIVAVPVALFLFRMSATTEHAPLLRDVVAVSRTPAVSLPASRPFAAWFTTPWLIGGCFCYAWLGLGWAASRRLAHRAIPTPSEYQVWLRRIASELRLRTRIVLTVSDRVSTPILVGVVRPIIVFPASLLTNLSPQQLEFVVLHEVAHMLRRDNLVQWVQRLLMPLTFFQPGAWLVSAWIREEREHCCDAFVLRHRHEPRGYAKTLLLLAESKTAEVRLHAAVTGGPLVARIRRILNLEEPTVDTKRGTVLLGLVVLSCVLIWPTAADSNWWWPNSVSNSLASGESAGVTAADDRTPCLIASDADCASCHVLPSKPKERKSPHGTRPADEYQRADDAQCSHCHESEVEPLRNPHGILPRGHAEVGQAACTACHLAPAKNPHALPMGDAACSDCHTESVKPETNPHRVPAPDALPHGHLDVEPGSCANCHVVTDPQQPKSHPRRDSGSGAGPAKKAPHPMIDQPCSTCHVTPKLTPAEQTLIDHQKFSGQPCQDCHTAIRPEKRRRP